tara:strand:- start:188 stop:463 length:276 start_codon:yes stop_codon:yes gene_type:complete
MVIHTSLDNKTTSGTKPMKTPNPNQTAKQELINANVPEHLHKLVTGLIICITTEYDYRYEVAKEICDYESLTLSDKDIKLAQNKALSIIYS